MMDAVKIFKILLYIYTHELLQFFSQTTIIHFKDGKTKIIYVLNKLLIKLYIFTHFLIPVLTINT